MSQIEVLRLDGFDTGDIGLAVDSRLSGWRIGASRSAPLESVPGAVAFVRTSNTIRWQPRSPVVRGSLHGANLTELQNRLKELKYRCAKRPLTLKLTDDTTVSYSGEQDGDIDVDYVPPAMRQLAYEITIPFICRDPRLYEDALQSIGLSVTPVAVPQGTAPVGPKIILNQDCTFTLKDSGGTTQKTTTLTGGSNFPVTFDMAAKSILNNIGGSEVANFSGDFPWDIDPILWADYPGLAWPTLELSTGTGTVEYQKAHL